VIAALVDVGALFKVFYSSLLAGVGVAIAFSLVIYGTTRAAEERRGDHAGSAAAFGTLAAVAIPVSLGAAVYGVVLVAHK
jgi:hypothetical protein